MARSHCSFSQGDGRPALSLHRERRLSFYAVNNSYIRGCKIGQCNQVKAVSEGEMDALIAPALSPSSVDVRDRACGRPLSSSLMPFWHGIRACVSRGAPEGRCWHDAAVELKRTVQAALPSGGSPKAKVKLP